MCDDTPKQHHAKRAAHYLASAKTNLSCAQESAEGTGDRKLIAQVNKLHDETVALQKEIADKLDSCRG